jgi:AraC-like DNA-binding protein
VQLLTGLTPNQYLQEILFNHARQLLEQRRVSSVKAAAAAIGIQTTQYFSEQFKTRFGKLPSDYLT